MVRSDSNLATLFHIIMILAGIAVIISAMIQAKVILIPFMMAIIVVIISRGPIFWFQKKGVPEWLALCLVIILLGGSILLVVTVVGSSMKDFLQNIPQYKTELQQQTDQFYTFMRSKGVHLSGKGFDQILNPGVVMGYAGQLFSDLSALLANGFLVLLLAVFMMLEARSFPVKIKAIFGPEDTKLLRFQEFSDRVKEYMTIKTVVSLLTGVLVSLSLFVIGVDYPLMWGMLAFAFNFIPNIGSIIAAIPAVLLALLQLGPVSALIAAACYLVINMVVGTVIEPRFMGRGLGLSTLVVFLSLLFWGWVFGPIGMLLSALLTMTVKMCLDSNEETRWLALLLEPATTEEI